MFEGVKKRLAAKLSELSKKFWGQSLKIQPRMSFDLTGLKKRPFQTFWKLPQIVPKIDGSYEL